LAAHVIPESSVCQQKGQKDNIEIWKALPKQGWGCPTEGRQDFWQVMEMASKTPPAYKHAAHCCSGHSLGRLPTVIVKKDILRVESAWQTPDMTY